MDATLNNWRLTRRRGPLELRGTVANADGVEGERIYTGAVTGVALRDGAIGFDCGDARYTCSLAELAFPQRLYELEAFGFSGADVERLILESERCREERRRQSFSELTGLIPSRPDRCVVIEFDPSAPYYFSRMALVAPDGGFLVSGDQAMVHTGMFQDSVIISMDEGDGMPDFRFFPYQRNRLEFYSFDDGCGPVFVANAPGAGCAIEVDAPGGPYLLPPGAWCQAARDVPCDYRIDRPTVPPIDKHSVYEARVIEGEDAVAYGRPANPVDGS